MSALSPRPATLPARVTVLGFARSGQALAKALLDRGVSVSVADDRPAAEFDAWPATERAGARGFFGGSSEKALDGAGWLAVSPGVPPSHAITAEARRRGLPVYSELEVAWRIAEEESSGRNRWVAVTGTNGKSTTTAWIAEMLRTARRPVALAGNIGAPLSGFLGERVPHDFVCEASSFQLETIDRFRPDVAVVTNVTPDHLDRYETFEDYAAAKERVFANQRPQDFAVVNEDDEVARRMRTRARRVPFSRRGPVAGGTWSEGGTLVSDVAGRRREVLPERRLSLSGAHNVENALAALATAECLDVPAPAIERALTGFAGLPHRTELVAEARGVRWVDDSKGTNVDATIKSLEGEPAGSVLLILGGRDKHGDFAKLAAPAARAARKALLIGEAAPVIAAAISGAVDVERVETMERAVERAAELARPGETVLLSPACASFDQYANFEERGRHFAELARKAAGERHGP